MDKQQVQRRLVVFHKNCVDGFTAAWVYWMQFGKHAQYHAALYYEPPPDVRDKDVIIVDFSYPRDVLLRMNVESQSLIVLDHHKSALATVGDLGFCHIDTAKAGCRLALEDAFRTSTLAAPWRWLIDYVEDRDLWAWRLPQSRLINAYIGSVPFDFDQWTALAMLGPDECAKRGEIVERTAEQYLSTLRACSYRIRFEEYDNIPCINAPQWRISEILNELAQDAPFAIGWHRRGDGKYAYSLRSLEVDVAAIAMKYGGGGHTNAAGFILNAPVWVAREPVAKYETWLVENIVHHHADRDRLLEQSEKTAADGLLGTASNLSESARTHDDIARRLEDVLSKYRELLREDE